MSLRLFSELTEDGLNANSTATVSSALDVSDNKNVSFTVKAASGTHATHIITLQSALETSGDWITTASTLTGIGAVDNIQTTMKFVRLKVTTAEGAASTVNIIIQAK